MAKAPKAAKGDVAGWLRGLATRHGGVDEAVTGAGTPSESSTYTTGGKAFLFVSAKDGAYELRLKLGASKAEASRFSSKQPDRFAIGATGWAKISWPKGDQGPRAVLERWVDESHALFVPASSKGAPAGGRTKSPPMLKTAPMVKAPGAKKPVAARAKKR